MPRAEPEAGGSSRGLVCGVLILLVFSVAVASCGDDEPGISAEVVRIRDAIRWGDYEADWDVAVREIVRRGPALEPMLLRLLGSKESEDRLAAASALKYVAPLSPLAIDALAHAQDDPARWVRVVASVALGCAGARAGRVLPLLLHLSEKLHASPSTQNGRDTPSEERYHAFRLATLDWAIDRIAGTHVFDRAPDVRVRGLPMFYWWQKLWSRGPHAVSRRAPALNVLRSLPADVVLPHLIQFAVLEVRLFRYSPYFSPSVLEKPYSALALIAERGEDAVPHLLAALRDAADSGEGTVRSAVLRVLRWLGSDAAPAVPLALEILRTGSPPERLAAVRLLASIGPASGAAVPVLIGMLESRRRSEMGAVRDALAEIGPAAAEGAEGIEARLRDAGHAVDTCSVWLRLALRRMREGDDALRSALQDPDDSLRREAWQVLGERMEDWPDHLDLLRRGFRDSDKRIHEDATERLLKYGAEGHEYLLEEAARSPVVARDIIMRIGAWALRYSLPANRPPGGSMTRVSYPRLVPLLLDGLDSTSPEVRSHAATALW